MVAGNCWIGKFDVAKDGIHLNRRETKNLGIFSIKSSTLVFREMYIGSCESSLEKHSLRVVQKYYPNK